MSSDAKRERGEFKRKKRAYKKSKADAKCNVCGTSEDLIWAADPYRSELHGDDDPIWLCSKCRQDSAEAI